VALPRTEQTKTTLELAENQHRACGEYTAG